MVRESKRFCSVCRFSGYTTDLHSHTQLLEVRADPVDLESSFLNAPDSPLQPASFGNSFSSDDDPHAWAQRLRNIPDKVRCRLLLAGSHERKGIHVGRMNAIRYLVLGGAWWRLVGHQKEPLTQWTKCA